MHTDSLKAGRTISLIFLCALAYVPSAIAQDDDARRPATAAAKPGPWFGLTLPPQTGDAPAVMVGPRAPRAVTLPPGESASPELEGNRIKADVNTIVGFSHESRQRREIGSGQMWGRVTGFPSSSRTSSLASRHRRLIQPWIAQSNCSRPSRLAALVADGIGIIAVRLQARSSVG